MTAPTQSEGPALDSELFGYALALADDALVSAQRMGEWIAAAPQLEEDVALANIGLDLLGQARALLTYAGEVEGRGRDEDALAYFRDERDFRNVWLVERPQGHDFAVCVARMLALASYQHELYTALLSSTDDRLAAVAAKAVKEVAYHRDHATQWTLRLGDGTAESHARLQSALDEEWRYVPELFDARSVPAGLVSAGVAPDPETLRAGFAAYVEPVLRQATLDVPDVPAAVTGGRRGVHSEHLGLLLAEMQHLARSHPGAQW